MNIFLDTTVTYNDPFLKDNNHNRSFLELARASKGITFYMSEIVYKESRRHFINKVRLHLETISKHTKDLHKYKSFILNDGTDSYNDTVNDRKLEGFINDFDAFYSSLQKEGLLVILPTPNHILPELIERSVNRIKPFKENKSEFRDAATWLTYSNYVEEKQLTNCFFITNNTNDFFDDQKKKIHPDLLKDTEKFEGHFSIQNMVQTDQRVKNFILEKQNKQKELYEWIAQSNIDESYIINYLRDTLKSASSSIFNDCSNYITSLVEKSTNTVSHHFTVDKIEIKNLKNFKIEIIAEETLISGKLTVLSTYSYLAISPYNEEMGTTSSALELEVPFSLTILLDATISNIQTENIQLLINSLIE